MQPKLTSFRFRFLLTMRAEKGETTVPGKSLFTMRAEKEKTTTCIHNTPTRQRESIRNIISASEILTCGNRGEKNGTYRGFPG